MRTKKIILQTRSSGQQCSFSKATFQNTTTRNSALMCCQSSSHGSPLLWSSGSQCNVKWSRSPTGETRGRGRGTEQQEVMWNLTVLKPYFTHIYLPYIESLRCYLLMALDKKNLGDGFKMSKKYQCYLNAECQTLWQTCDKLTPDTPSPHRVSSSITFWSFLWLFSQFLRNSKGNFVLICTSKLCMCQ